MLGVVVQLCGEKFGSIFVPMFDTVIGFVVVPVIRFMVGNILKWTENWDKFL